MAEKKKTTAKNNHRRMRRMRRFGFDNVILSNVTVYLNPYAESNSSLSTEDAAMFAAVAKYFNDSDS